MIKGRFISFEGGEGSGKSTQIKHLAAHLRAKNIEVIITREPGGTAEGESIRDLLVTGDPERWDGLSEALMNYAARKRHVDSVIKPALYRGVWVLSDRFADSTMAYQGLVQEVGEAIINQLHRLVLGSFYPSLTIILDLDPDLGLRRSKKRNIRSGSQEMRYEQMGITFHKKLRTAFRLIAKNNPSRCVRIDASQSEIRIAQMVWKVVVKRFKF